MLSYIGEARLGVQIKKETLERCMSTAKTATKLALNLIEFIIPEDLMKTGVSVYGNAQFRLKSMPSNMVAALKGKVWFYICIKFVFTLYIISNDHTSVKINNFLLNPFH